MLATFSKATITESDKGSGNEFRDVQLQLEWSEMSSVSSLIRGAQRVREMRRMTFQTTVVERYRTSYQSQWFLRLHPKNSFLVILSVPLLYALFI